jgi:predicted aconitase
MPPIERRPLTGAEERKALGAALGAGAAVAAVALYFARLFLQRERS